MMEVSTDGALIALSGLNCTGDEDKLVECPHPGFGNHSCKPEQAAGLYCGGIVLVLCNLVAALLIVNVTTCRLPPGRDALSRNRD